MATQYIVVQNATQSVVDERVSAYAELSAGGEGQSYSADLLENATTGEYALVFKGDIPYYHFTLLLTALNMPWINNTGAKAAGWATPKDGTGRFMHFSNKDEADYLLAIDKDTHMHVVEAGQLTTLTDVDSIDVEYFEPAIDTEAWKTINSYTLVLDEFVEEEEVVEEELMPVAPKEAKQMGIVTIIVIIAIASAGIIALFLLAE